MRRHAISDLMAHFHALPVNRSSASLRRMPKHIILLVSTVRRRRNLHHVAGGDAQIISFFPYYLPLAGSLLGRPCGDRREAAEFFRVLLDESHLTFSSSSPMNLLGRLANNRAASNANTLD